MVPSLQLSITVTPPSENQGTLGRNCINTCGFRNLEVTVCRLGALNLKTNFFLRLQTLCCVFVKITSSLSEKKYDSDLFLCYFDA